MRIAGPTAHRQHPRLPEAITQSRCLLRRRGLDESHPVTQRLRVPQLPRDVIRNLDKYHTFEPKKCDRSVLGSQLERLKGKYPGITPTEKMPFKPPSTRMERHMPKIGTYNVF